MPKNCSSTSVIASREIKSPSSMLRRQFSGKRSRTDVWLTDSLCRFTVLTAIPRKTLQEVTRTFKGNNSSDICKGIEHIYSPFFL